METTSSRHNILSSLYIQHHGWLQGWLRKKLGCQHKAADLAQDTFLRLLIKQIETYDFSTPRIYLAHIANGLLVDHWRRQTLERQYLAALSLHETDVAGSLDVQAVIIETLVEIDKMLSKLPAKVSQAFLLAQIDGLTYKEISAIIGVSERMVKKYMATAMLHCLLLKRQLVEY